MGSFRRQLGAATLMLAASPSYAEVCAQMRPNWTPGAPASAWDELIALMSTPPSLVLILASLIAIRFAHQWGALIVVLLWTLWVSLVAMSSPDAARLAALQEGCIGSPTLFIAAVAAICVGMILYTTRRAARL